MPNVPPPDFIVVGLQRSGSSWVNALLSGHPNIVSFPTLWGDQTGVSEGHIFDNLAKIKEDGGKSAIYSFTHYHNDFFTPLVPLIINKASKEDLYDAVRERYNLWCDIQRKKTKKKLAGEKTVEYIFCLDLIDEIYPGIKKLCILRDPRDRVVSFHFHQLRRGQKKEKGITIAYARNYCQNRINPEYEKLLAYSGNIHCFTYEQLSYEPKEALSKILKYLKAKVSDKIIEDMIKEGSFESVTARDKIANEGKRKKGEQSMKSHYRKGVVEDWKNHLTTEQVNIIKKETSLLQNKVSKKYNLPKYYD
jgi:hypothetical protein